MALKRNMTFDYSMMSPGMRSPQDLSHRRFHSWKQGELFPVTCIEVLPQDTFTTIEEKFIRSSTPLKPVMDNCYTDTFWFFCRGYLLWDHAYEFLVKPIRTSMWSPWIIKSRL